MKRYNFKLVPINDGITITYKDIIKQPDNFYDVYKFVETRYF